MPQPTIVFVHGAWHGPWAWDAVIRELPDLTTRTVALSSAGHDPATLGDMYTDAAAIREMVTAIEGPVLVVAHSYGGVPTTEGLAGLSQVSRLVYLASPVMARDHPTPHARGMAHGPEHLRAVREGRRHPAARPGGDGAAGRTGAATADLALTVPVRPADVASILRAEVASATA